MKSCVRDLMFPEIVHILWERVTVCTSEGYPEMEIWVLVERLLLSERVPVLYPIGFSSLIIPISSDVSSFDVQLFGTMSLDATADP